MTLRMKKGIGGLFLFLLVATLLYNALFSFSYSHDPNYRNVSVDTTVNITNAGPTIESITTPTVTLTAGSTKLVECNVTVLDYNGAGDINYTEAVFYHSSSSAAAADDNNTHYSNASCLVTGQSGNYKNFTCGFAVYYFALNGTWTCNATTYDNSTFNDTRENTTTVNALLALNVTPTLIDYGDLAVSATSANKTANVSNIGNTQINISVTGYGATFGDGYAFICDQGNITIGNEKYSASSGDDYAAKDALTSGYVMIPGVSIQKQDVFAVSKWNMTYWQLYVPPNPFGICNGTVVFQAESA